MVHPRQTQYWRVILVPEWGMWETIDGDYSVDEVVLHGHHWRIRKVEWNHKSFNGWEFALSEGVKTTLGQRSTVVELSESEHGEIEKQKLSL